MNSPMIFAKGGPVKMECVGFEPLHLHSFYSTLDGYGSCDEYCSHWKAYGDYFSVSDHGVMSAIPNQIKSCQASNKKDDPYRHKKLTPIFSCELYVNPMQIEYSTKDELQDYIKSLNPEETAIMRKRGFHLLAIAYTDEGYSNLVQLCSAGWTKGFYYRPRVNHEQLKRHKEGIIFTSCCYASEVGQAFDKGGEEAGFAMIEKYVSMFGKENYYLEIMLLDFVKQKPYNIFILKAQQKYGLKVITTCDTHYCKPEDSKYQRLMLMVQTKNTIASIQKKMEEEGIQDMFELQDSNLWMKTEEELNAKWLSDYSDVIDLDIFQQSKRNTVEICRRAAGVKLDRSMKLPQIPDANEKLQEAIFIGFKNRHLPSKGAEGLKYINRIKEEYSLICRKEFSSYFLIQKMITDEARRICKDVLGWGTGNEAVSPGRGSSGGSLICYCLNITDIDPIRHDLLFSRFLSETRGGKTIKLEFDIDPIPFEEAT